MYPEDFFRLPLYFFYAHAAINPRMQHSPVLRSNTTPVSKHGFTEIFPPDEPEWSRIRRGNRDYLWHTQFNQLKQK